MDTLEVLVVDDDTADRKLVRRYLSSAFPEATLHEADDEDSALACPAPRLDAILLDYLLPGCTGLELLPDLRQKYPGAACIMLTGQGDEVVAKSAIKHGACDYIPKRSLTVSALQRMIERGLELAEMQAKLDDQRRELEVFADVLVHDLKAPIRAVNFLTSELAEDLAAGDHGSIDQTLALLRRSAMQMRALVDSLATHIRIDREVEFETASLREIVTNAMFALNRDITETQADIRLHFEDRPLHCCVPQLSQLLQNVISNAIKYRADRRPEIRITAELVEEGWLRIAVSDNGIGIDRQYVDRIFEPFKRAPSTDDIAGSGLGLATCRKIADRHEGTIWCQSEPGVGTTVFLDIPHREASEGAAMPTKPLSNISDARLTASN
ncbi:sensor histidine kinase [Pseudoponticoccus marisrubri]|uniref:histidine kinase n=1 Tax=Pseudoponticoccus marisrubri TaxID=1685382 RepID=A0A0W7WMI2_9RHOB|nr:ATP-binding protein [Pseudoponticoccus marisrubri]KUF11790.1 hypothetical protein AVJ23_04185 [Pseudoponticoccus marisrubri]